MQSRFFTRIFRRPCFKRLSVCISVQVFIWNPYMFSELCFENHPKDKYFLFITTLLSKSVHISYGQCFESCPDKILLVEEVIRKKRFIDLKVRGFSQLLISYFQYFVRHGPTCHVQHYVNSYFLKPRNNQWRPTAKLAVYKPSALVPYCFSWFNFVRTKSRY